MENPYHLPWYPGFPNVPVYSSLIDIKTVKSEGNIVNITLVVNRKKGSKLMWTTEL